MSICSTLQGKAKKKLKTPSAVQTHDRDTIKTFGRSLEDNVDTINYVSHAAVPGIEEPPLPPPETQLRWKLSLEEIEHRRTLNRLDEIKRYILFSHDGIPPLFTIGRSLPVLAILLKCISIYK